MVDHRRLGGGLPLEPVGATTPLCGDVGLAKIIATVSPLAGIRLTLHYGGEKSG